MPFRLRIADVLYSESELIVSGALIEGAYIGPEAVSLCDESGNWTSTLVLQHEIRHPKNWPVTPGDGSTLVLHIAQPNRRIKLDPTQVIIGEGALFKNERRVETTEYVTDPGYWAIQMTLHAASDCLPDPLLAWGLTQEDEIRDYHRLFEVHWNSDVWPFIRLKLRDGHYVELEYTAGIEHQERVWLGDDRGRRVLMGYHSGHFSFPSFRIAEILALAKHIESHPSAPLLLLPGAYLAKGDSLPRTVLSHWVEQVPGVKTEFIPAIVDLLVGECRA